MNNEQPDDELTIEDVLGRGRPGHPIDARSPYDMLTPQERDEVDAGVVAESVVDRYFEFHSGEVRNKVWGTIYEAVLGALQAWPLNDEVSEQDPLNEVTA